MPVRAAAGAALVLARFHPRWSILNKTLAPFGHLKFWATLRIGGNFAATGGEIMQRSSKLGAAMLALALIGWPGLAAAAESASKKTHTFILPAGATSPAVNVPAENVPVLMMADQMTGGNIGEGQATILRSTTDAELDWVATDFFLGVTRSYNSSPGTHIFWTDYFGCVDVQVANATSVWVHNGCGFQQTVYLTFIW